MSVYLTGNARRRQAGFQIGKVSTQLDCSKECYLSRQVPAANTSYTDFFLTFSVRI